MSVWLGMDEAGYGPYLGPLVVAAAAFRVPDGTDEAGLWELLAEGVSRRGRKTGDRVVVDDSKKVYTSGGLQALEQTVLAFTHLAGGMPDSVHGLLERFSMPGGEDLAPYPWYERLAERALPVEATRARLLNLAESLRVLGPDAPCRFLGLRFIAVHPGEFNRMVDVTHNKSLVEFHKCGILLAFAWEKYGREGLMVAIDRQGGRSFYLRLLVDVFPDAEFQILHEDDQRSAYRVVDGPRHAVIVFKIKADRTCLPVALASMTAKYVREVFMQLFNEYWQGRVPGLRPTAGYPQDARRFIEAIDPLLDERPALRRLTVRSR